MISPQKWLAQEDKCELSELNTKIPRKRQYLPHYYSNKSFKNTVMNRALPSGHGESLEIKLFI